MMQMVSIIYGVRSHPQVIIWSFILRRLLAYSWLWKNEAIQKPGRSYARSKSHNLGGLATEQALIHFKNSDEKHIIMDDALSDCCCSASLCRPDLEAWATMERRMVNIFVQVNKEGYCQFKR